MHGQVKYFLKSISIFFHVNLNIEYPEKFSRRFSRVFTCQRTDEKTLPFIWCFHIFVKPFFHKKLFCPEQPNDLDQVTPIERGNGLNLTLRSQEGLREYKSKVSVMKLLYFLRNHSERYTYRSSYIKCINDLDKVTDIKVSYRLRIPVLLDCALLIGKNLTIELINLMNSFNSNFKVL